MAVNMNLNADDARFQNHEWLGIKHTGKYETNYVNAPIKDVNWVYTPSGRFCVCVWDVAKKDEQKQYNINEYLFTFIDLVNKEYFEMLMKFEPFLTNRLNASKVDCFYFSSEDEMVVIAAYNGLVKQLVYKVDYFNHNLELQETINYNFTQREKFFNERLGRIFTYQPNKFVCCDRKDYALLVSDKEIWGLFDYFHMYMIPKDPDNKDAPTQEFCFYYKKHFRDSDKRIETALGENGAKFSRFFMTAASHPCIIRDTKLWFTLQLSVYSDDPMEHSDVPGTLIGANWTVDFKKLKNIKEEQIDGPQKLLEILKEQASWHTLEDAAVFHLAEHLHFWQSDPDVGFINVFTQNAVYDKNVTVAHTYPTNVGGAKPVILDAQLVDREIGGCYTLHLHGALLNVVFNEESIHLRVVKYLKANLKSLALSRALFHKDTPIRHHPAYRLCFNGEKL